MARLYDWYVKRVEDNAGSFLTVCGIVTGHIEMDDSTSIASSKVQNIYIEEGRKKVIIKTLNSTYYCNIKDMLIHKMDEQVLRDYSRIGELYEPREQEDYRLSEDSILLVLGNNKVYYYNTGIIRECGRSKWMDRAKVQIGKEKDSVRAGMYSVRTHHQYEFHYHPYKENFIEFHTWENCGLPVYIENCGDAEFFIKSPNGMIRLKSGERKEITCENAERTKLTLTEQTLYNEAWA